MVSQQPTPPDSAATKLPDLYQKPPVAKPARMVGLKEQRPAHPDGTSATSITPSKKRGCEEFENDMEQWIKANKHSRQINNKTTEFEARPIKRVKCQSYDGKAGSNETAAIPAQFMPLLSIADLMAPPSKEDMDALRRVQQSLDRDLDPAVKKMREEDAMRDAAENKRVMRKIQLALGLEVDSAVDTVSALLAKISDMARSEDEERARKRAENEAGHERYAAARRQMEAEEAAFQQRMAVQQQHIDAARQNLSRYDDEIRQLTAEARRCEAEANRLKEIRELEDKQREKEEAERKRKEQELEHQREIVESAYDKLLAANTDGTPLAQLSMEVPSKQSLLDQLSNEWQRVHSDLETIMPEHLQDADDVTIFDLYLISRARNTMLMLRLQKRQPQELIGAGWQLPILDRLRAVLDAASGGAQLEELKCKVDGIRWLLQEAYSELEASATVSPTHLSNSLSGSTSSYSTETSKAQETTPDTSPEREYRQMPGAVQEEPSGGSESEYSPPTEISVIPDRPSETPRDDVDDESSDSNPDSEQSNGGDQDVARNKPFAAPLGHYESKTAEPVKMKYSTAMNKHAPSTSYNHTPSTLYTPKAHRNFRGAHLSDTDDEDAPIPSVEIPKRNCEPMPAQEIPRSNDGRTKNNNNRGKASSSVGLSPIRTTEKNGIRRKDDVRSPVAARQLASVQRVLTSQAPSSPARNRQSRAKTPQETPGPSSISMPATASLPARLDRSLDDLVRESRNAGRKNGRGNGGGYNGRGNGGNKPGRGNGRRNRGGR
ncbi:hypothetical protein K505DRAFT_360176 [Melanomma pulvis-pyrius CBS 109.77]|uniref:Uncharacterized protein n=1 Tax=Melanomma pulvis-pyrius CBS 109.77 TaxID=1314802 RepID=A0A6A6XFX8_9PLEO|nr:hypothetical protein K505DRAFT_360176 [Melanomma pulvis-pyrius CBS 109.77]